MKVCQCFSKVQLRDQRIRANELATRKKTIQGMFAQVDKKAKNFIDILREGGIVGRSSMARSRYRSHHEFFGTSVKMKGREKVRYTHNWMMCDIKGA
jgi:hypothetical protein